MLFGYDPVCVAVPQCGTGSVPGVLLSMLAACTGLKFLFTVLLPSAGLELTA